MSRSETGFVGNGGDESRTTETGSRNAETTGVQDRRGRRTGKGIDKASESRGLVCWTSRVSVEQRTVEIDARPESRTRWQRKARTMSADGNDATDGYATRLMSRAEHDDDDLRVRPTVQTERRAVP